MTDNGVLEQILDRLARAETAKAIFGADEMADWPAGVTGALNKEWLLQAAKPAQAVECKGCEEYCFMSVHVLPADGSRAARAFISCDKHDDIGRVPVAMRKLDQRQITGGQLAKALARLLGFDRLPREDSAGKRWTLGILKGKECKGQVTLIVENGVSLKVAGHDIPLTELLTISKANLALDMDELVNRVDKPATPPGGSDNAGYLAKLEVRKLDAQAMREGWQKAYRHLKRQRPNMSAVWYSKQIEKNAAIAVGRNAETIRKHMTK